MSVKAADIAKITPEAGFERVVLRELATRLTVKLINYDKKKQGDIIRDALAVLKKARLKPVAPLRAVWAVDGMSVIAEVEKPEPAKAAGRSSTGE